MVHLRLNDPDTSRNKHINYITALPQYADHEQARHRLLQLAAQVQPVMKKHGFQINSLEEFQWNHEFAGRNWNNGETVELVLRRQDGSFAPLQWVLMVFCHELAHIKYMNHIPSQHGKLDRELRNECRQLQSRGYYGDGFWSAGQRLQDNAFVAGSGMNSLEGLPEYSCGGAFHSKQTKGRARKRRRTTAASGSRKRGFQGPSLHTGAQTAPNTKGGRRMQAPLPGSGSRVDGNNHLPQASASSSSYKQDANSTFRKRTQTASARELRAQAALRRFNAAKTEDDEVKMHTRGSFWPMFEADNKPQSHLSVPSTQGDRAVKAEESTETGSETGSETEDEEDKRDGGLIICLDDSSENEADSKDESATSHSEQDSRTVATTRVKNEENTDSRSTLATRESEKQRMDRARLYRQHESKQGGRIRSTNEDWQGFCSISIVPDPSSAAQDLAPSAKNWDQNSKHDPIEILSSDDESSQALSKKQSVQRRVKQCPPSAAREWTCQVCTLRNPAHFQQCDACLTSRGSDRVGQ